MYLLGEKIWNSGLGCNLDFKEIESLISSHSKKQEKIFIGSDSFVTRDKTHFVTAICILTKNLGGRYFFYKESVPTHQYKNLPTRITEEVRRSIEVAEYFVSAHKIPTDLFELHLDISPPSAKNGTSKFSDMLKGYVRGYGLSCKLKPHAWASQTVADRHSK